MLRKLTARLAIHASDHFMSASERWFKLSDATEDGFPTVSAITDAAGVITKSVSLNLYFLGVVLGERP